MISRQAPFQYDANASRWGSTGGAAGGGAALGAGLGSAAFFGSGAGFVSFARTSSLEVLDTMVSTLANAD